MTNVAQLGWRDASLPRYLANGIRGVKPSGLLEKTTNQWRRPACAAVKPVRGATAAYVKLAVEKHRIIAQLLGPGIWIMLQPEALFSFIVPTHHVKIKAKATRMAAKHRGGGRRKTLGYVGKGTMGTVVPPPEANLPERTTVRVEPLVGQSLAKRLKNVIGVIRNMPSDWAENHDHYLHGAPKK